MGDTGKFFQGSRIEIKITDKSDEPRDITTAQSVQIDAARANQRSQKVALTTTTLDALTVEGVLLPSQTEDMATGLYIAQLRIVWNDGTGDAEDADIEITDFIEFQIAEGL